MKVVIWCLDTPEKHFAEVISNIFSSGWNRASILDGSNPFDHRNDLEISGC